MYRLDAFLDSRSALTRGRGIRLLSLSLVACLAGAPSTAGAAPETLSLHEVRQSLTAYDLNGATLELLKRIGQGLADAPMAQRQELRFLRAAAASDLYLIARLRDNDELVAHLERALDVPAGGLDRWLDDELAQARGAYSMPALSLRAVLRYQAAPDAAQLAALAGTQGDLLRLRSLQRAADARTLGIAELAELAEDPCAGDNGCDARFAQLESAARRAARALEGAAQTLFRLRRAQDAGDPLARALAEELTDIETSLNAIRLRPVPKLPSDVALPDAAMAQPVRPDLVLIVTSEAVLYGFAPTLRLGSDGSLETVQAQEPMLPTLARIPLPSRFPPYLKPLPDVRDLLSKVGEESADLKVAVGAAAGTPAHLVARVMVTLHAKGYDKTFMLARSAEGFARAVAVGLASKRDESTQEARLRVRIRLGGYSLHLGDSFEDIPRIRDDSGLHFDVPALLGHLGPRVQDADISFMADVSSDTLLTTTMHVARRSDRVRIVFP